MKGYMQKENPYYRFCMQRKNPNFFFFFFFEVWFEYFLWPDQNAR